MSHFLFPLKESCRVRDRATRKFVQCEFPFKYKGKTHNGCIDYIDIKNGTKVPGELWCSTKVSGSDRQHVTGGGHYGECDSSCPGGSRPTTRPPTTPSTTAITTSTAQTTTKSTGT